MASVRPHKWRNGRTCKQETSRPPHGDNCTCKVQSWRCFWRQPDGSKRSEVFDHSNGGKRAADAKKAEVESAQNKGTYTDPSRGKVLFREYAAMWASVQSWKASSRKQWPHVLKRLEPHLGGLRLCDIDRETLEATRTALTERYARATVEGTMHRAMAILRYAVANGRIGRDPTTGLDAAPRRRADDPIGRVTPDMVPTRAEALALLTSAPDGFRAAVALGTAGLRIGETLGLHVDRVDLPGRRVTVYWQTDGYDLTTPKAEKRRTIVVPQLVAVELRRHLRDHPGGLLFEGGGRECPCGMCDRCKAEGLTSPGRGKRCRCRPGCGRRLLHKERFYELAWYPTLRAAKLTGRFKFHSLRHFCASNLLAEGAPLPAVAGYLGDTVQTVSKRYAHWLRDDVDVPAEVLDRVLATATTDASRLPHAVESGGE